MDQPTVHNRVLFEDKNTSVDIVAYRKLSDFELRQALAVFRGFPVVEAGRRLKKNSTYVVMSLYGLRDE